VNPIKTEVSKYDAISSRTFPISTIVKTCLEDY
jgi:hypothetical protein